MVSFETAVEERMAAYRDLRIFCDAAQRERLLTLTEAWLTEGWERDRAKECALNEPGGGYSCFVRAGADGYPDAAFVLTSVCYGLQVMNIVPREGELTPQRYNYLLIDFYLRFVDAAALEAGALVELTSDERRPKTTRSNDPKISVNLTEPLLN